MAFLKRFDWYLNGSIFFLLTASLLALFSNDTSVAWRQIITYAVGIFVMILVARFDWRSLSVSRNFIALFYASAVLLLIIVYLVGPTIRGIRGWFVIGPLQFQPAELIKVALIILYAYFFAKRHVSIARIRNTIVTFIYFAIPAVLLMLQPDLGSALILFGIWGGFLLVSGIKWRHLLVAILIFSAIGFLMWQSALKPYQKERVLGFFSQESDPLGVNYSAIQSKIAIGSAGLFGKGFNQGTQVQLGFLPEATNDFIFAAFVEEWGLVGGMLIIAALFFLVYRIVIIGLGSENNFSRFICLGTAMLFIVQFFFNIGSSLGLTPVIGVSYPFLSAGGSNLLINFFLVGVIHSISTRTYP